MTTKSIGLFYFSGTGNTQFVTELLAEAFKQHDTQVDIVRMEHVLQGQAQFNPETYDLIGIGHPIHGLDAPRIVYDFIHALPSIRNKRTFIFKTAADFISMNNGASKTAIKRLRRKGYDVFYDRIICMPSNWAIKYDDTFSKQLCYTAIAKAEHMANEVLSGQKRDLKINSPLRWIAKLISRGEDLGARFFGKMLTVSNACIDCGRCIDNCPTVNIHRENGKISFGYDCVFCMRCIYACPQQAIIPRFTKCCVLEDGYNIKAIINNSDIEEDFVTKETKGFFKHFFKYFQDIKV